ncbi:MAG TPA: FAD-dependent monooxygenase [Tepidisphaeraceae bacterium]|nr:FAD-dependent monooxygenase [Tepidisphaeraceae bacterium]
MPDVLIIGAGPAGAFAGLLLARAGLSVTLIDQHQFPRDKVCGECLSPLAIEVLQRAQLLNHLHNAGATVLTRFALHSPQGHSTCLPLPRPMLGLSRLRLDPLILCEARQAGALLRERVRCEGICKASHGQPIRARLRDLHSNRVEELPAQHILLADGRSALASPKPPPTGDFGLKAHFAGINAPRDAIELFGIPGHYGGLAPIEHDLWNIAFSVPQTRLHECPNLDRLFTRITHQNTTLLARMATARRVSDWLASPLPRFGPRAHWLPNLIPLGIAVAAIEPIAGEGMGLALRSAELAVQALLNGTPAPELFSQYQALWRVRRTACRLAAIAVSHPAFCTAAVALLNSSPAIAHFALRSTGKVTPIPSI